MPGTEDDDAGPAYHVGLGREARPSAAHFQRSGSSQRPGEYVLFRLPLRVTSMR
jgi:hypothetical protein